MGQRTGLGIGELEALYRERLPDFVRVAAAITGDEGRGAEAVQEAFARAIRSRETFRGDAPLEAWVWRIVVNAARAARREGHFESLVDIHSGSEPNGRSRSADEVKVWIAALPERQRLAVFLRYFADLDYAGIAVVLGVEIGTVSATLAAAHKTLRESLKEAVE